MIDLAGIIQGARAHEQAAWCAMILAPHIRTAVTTKEYLVGTATAAFELRNFRGARQQLYLSLLDPHVHYKVALPVIR